MSERHLYNREVSKKENCTFNFPATTDRIKALRRAFQGVTPQEVIVQHTTGSFEKGVWRVNSGEILDWGGLNDWRLGILTNQDYQLIKEPAGWQIVIIPVFGKSPWRSAVLIGNQECEVKRIVVGQASPVLRRLHLLSTPSIPVENQGKTAVRIEFKMSPELYPQFIYPHKTTVAEVLNKKTHVLLAKVDENGEIIDDSRLHFRIKVP